jgi:hypothetical protein
LAKLAAAGACVPDDGSDADGPDEVAAADSSDEADEPESQAASRTRDKSALATSRTPIPFFMKIASYLLLCYGRFPMLL